MKLECIPLARQKFVWLLILALLTVFMVGIGGLTRLTGSGLSMVQWKIIGGVLPPLNDRQWEQAFDRYKKYPEFKQINFSMSLGKFKFIYWMEYIHRLWGRLLGIATILPLVYFALRRTLSSREAWSYGGLFFLVCLQGWVGWYMVQSGLVDRPSVSPYRLVLHLGLALAFLTWIVVEIGALFRFEPMKASVPLRISLLGLITLLALQIALGGFMAGWDAGHVSDTFPKMQGDWLPQAVFAEKSLRGIFSNPVTIHFLHRWMGIGLLVYAAFAFFFILRQDHRWMKNISGVFLACLGAQAGLGVIAVIYHVPLWTAIAHQMLGIFVWILVLWIQMAISNGGKSHV